MKNLIWQTETLHELNFQLLPERHKQYLSSYWRQVTLPGVTFILQIAVGSGGVRLELP